MHSPRIIYGTAWKEERTEELVRMALAAGFRAFDTANQRKHYVEVAVGRAIEDSHTPRERLFLQTKFTYRDGQDHRLPYDPSAPLAAQVEQSFESSLEHLRTSYIDSYLLHGPATANAWTDADREVWETMENLVRSGRARAIGVSNISLGQLAALCSEAREQPTYVQNRCFAVTGWDREVRDFCRRRDIVYQGFSLLTANRRELAHPDVAAIAVRADATVEQVVFSFAARVGIVPLTGTTSERHMQDDLAAGDVSLSAADIEAIELLG